MSSGKPHLPLSELNIISIDSICHSRRLQLGKVKSGTKVAKTLAVAKPIPVAKPVTVRRVCTSTYSHACPFTTNMDARVHARTHP